MSLDDLRKELGDVDRSLLELIKRRQDLAREIGEVKREAGRATRDYEQERDVVQRARASAQAIGLGPDVAEELVLLLIRSSLTVQEKAKVRALGAGSGKSALVIGGAGQMGRWLLSFLESQGYEVHVSDPAGDVEGVPSVADWRDPGRTFDITAIAAPLKVSNEILHEMADKPPPGLIFDIGSLKSPLRSGLQALANAGARVTSVHPMFGPGTELLSGRHVIFVDLGHEEATASARELFESTMAMQVTMNIEDHDRLIAYVLGLSHAVNIAFFTALAESGEAAPRLAKLSSTTFDSQLRVCSSVASENPGLYFEIQYLNDYGTESLSSLLYAVERLRSIVRAGDAESFAKLMEQGRAYLQDRPSGGDAPP